MLFILVVWVLTNIHEHVHTHAYTHAHTHNYFVLISTRIITIKNIIVQSISMTFLLTILSVAFTLYNRFKRQVVNSYFLIGRV